MPVSGRLPDFPWDRLAPYAERGRGAPRRHRRPLGRHAGRPDARRSSSRRCAAAADAPGYPLTARHAGAARGDRRPGCARRRGVPASTRPRVLPTIGSKELVAWLPTLLGLGPGDVVVHPEVAYPTYDVGARLAGADAGRAPTALTALGPAAGRGWSGSTRPSNPTGRVLPVEHLRKVVAWARERGAVVASDECYVELGWDGRAGLGPAPDGLRRRRTTGCSRCTRCPSGPTWPATGPGSSPATRRWSRELLEVRKHAGMIVPAPVQAAMVAALGDDAHVARAAGALRARGALVLRGALEAAGFRIEHSEAGLYLWATRGEDCWAAGAPGWPSCGILVAPGAFYGPAGERHVRVALTATDERVAAAAQPVAPSPGRSVEGARRGEDAEPREVADRLPAVLVAGHPQIEPGVGLVDSASRRASSAAAQHDRAARRSAPAAPPRARRRRAPPPSPPAPARARSCRRACGPRAARRPAPGRRRRTPPGSRPGWTAWTASRRRAAPRGCRRTPGVQHRRARCRSSQPSSA